MDAKGGTDGIHERELYMHIYSRLRFVLLERDDVCVYSIAPSFAEGKRKKMERFSKERGRERKKKIYTLREKEEEVKLLKGS